jgi:uncharacterized protein DUF1217
MSFQPIIPTAGISGWRFLQRTHDIQLETFSSQSTFRNDADYFLKNAPKIRTASELVSDHRLLKTALTAFGLQDDLKNKFFIQKILEDGTTADDALANRLADNRYRQMSDAFGFGPDQDIKIMHTAVVQDIVERSAIRGFELAVGKQDESMRLALYARRSLGELAITGSSNDAKWYVLMGNPPLRKVVETALSLPQSFGQISLDQQLRTLKDKSQSILGTSNVNDLADPDVVRRIITGFLGREQISQSLFGQTGSSTALTILQAARSFGP